MVTHFADKCHFLKKNVTVEKTYSAQFTELTNLLMGESYGQLVQLINVSWRNQCFSKTLIMQNVTLTMTLAVYHPVKMKFKMNINQMTLKKREKTLMPDAC